MKEKKRKKRKLSEQTVEPSTEEIQKPKKSKKKKPELVSVEHGDCNPTLPKKKKKKNKDDKVGDSCTLDADLSPKSSRKKKSKEHAAKDCGVSDNDVECPVIHRKKKKNKENVDKELVDSVREDDCHSASLKKKKKTKDDVEDFSTSEDGCSPPSNKVTGAEDGCSPSSSKKRKKKSKEKVMEELNLSENETELVPRNTAAMDDVQAKKREKKNKRRNRKLATESENEAKSVQPAAVTMGQWSTADLGNSDRQNKFFKLMGGFGASHKTNLSNSNASPKPFAAKFNAALDKKRESQLQNRLEQQFDQARFTSLNAKGLGLGFTQPKKNSIDISAVRSKRFDD